MYKYNCFKNWWMNSNDAVHLDKDGPGIYSARVAGFFLKLNQIH